MSERETTLISSFSRWEQAFRIYSNLLTRVYPGKASELIQYNHIIYTASLSFAWDNVYFYNKEFRMHISKFPQHSWAIILQQAWSMCLKDKVRQFQDDNRPSKNVRRGGEPCHRFKKGKCTYGSNCKFDHRCAVKNVESLDMGLIFAECGTPTWMVAQHQVQVHLQVFKIKIKVNQDLNISNKTEHRIKC